MTDTTTVGHADPQTPPEPVSPVPSPARLLGLRAWGIVRDAALVTAVVLVPLIVIFRLWEGSLRTPFSYIGDSNFYAGITANIIDSGWYQETDRLGAPFGQELYDFALGGDNLNWLTIRFLTIFSQDWALVNNAFYLLTFPLVALSAFFVIRWLGAGRVTALTAAVLFAFLPYHFIRGGGHFVLASYTVVPIGVALAVRALRGQGPFWELRHRRPRGWLTGIGWLGCAVLVASGGTYYAVFTLVLVGAAAVIGAAANHTWRPLVAGCTVALVIASVLMANLLSSLLFVRENGDNTEVLERKVFEVDIYGLRVVQLLTPTPGHRVEPLANLSTDLQSGPLNSEQAMFLGTVGGLGLVVMIGWVLSRALARHRLGDGMSADAGSGGIDARSLLAVLAIVAIFVGTTGGLSWFTAISGLEEIRAWNRISIVIAFLVLAWLALTAELLRTRNTKPLVTAAVAAIAAVLMVLGIADQTSSAIVPDRRHWADTYHADRAYFTSIEAQLPTGASIFQLPYVPYPESGPVLKIVDYDPLRPYLHTQELRWSYGGMRGRDADRHAVVASQPVAELVDDVRAEGFGGVLVDRYGYEDAGLAVVTGLQQVLQDAGVESPDDRWVFFDLAVPAG